MTDVEDLEAEIKRLQQRLTFREAQCRRLTEELSWRDERIRVLERVIVKLGAS